MNRTGLIERASNALRNIAQRVLDVDDGSYSMAQVEMLEDFLGRFEFDTSNVRELADLLKVLQKKHLVDSICVASSNGQLIASTNGESFSEALTGTAMFNYVQSELPKSSVLLVRANGWYMVFPFKKKIFIIKAMDYLSAVELTVIAKEVEEFLAKK